MAAVSGFKEVPGPNANIPNDPRARLMYYLKCVMSCVDTDKDDDDMKVLTDYKNFNKLSKQSRRMLTVMCNMFAPGVLKGKVFFHDEKLSAGECKMFKPNEKTRFGFATETTKTVKIADEEMEIKQIMVYGKDWIVHNWETPIKQIVSYDKAY